VSATSTTPPRAFTQVPAVVTTKKTVATASLCNLYDYKNKWSFVKRINSNIHNYKLFFVLLA
jgi:hypothetical protein